MKAPSSIFREKLLSLKCIIPNHPISRQTLFCLIYADNFLSIDILSLSPQGFDSIHVRRRYWSELRRFQIQHPTKELTAFFAWRLLRNALKTRSKPLSISLRRTSHFNCNRDSIIGNSTKSFSFKSRTPHSQTIDPYLLNMCWRS